LRDARHGVVWQSCNTCRERDVARCVRPSEIARKGNAHSGGDPAAVQGVSPPPATMCYS
jgi:hypothetical protein